MRETIDVSFHVDERINNEEVFAIFPNISWSGNGDVTCYEHVGQHGEACPEYVKECRKATEDEYKDLLEELQRIYETNDEEHVKLILI